MIIVTPAIGHLKEKMPWVPLIIKCLENVSEKVKVIVCGTDNMLTDYPESLTKIKLERTAQKVLGIEKDMIFLRDILYVALSNSEDGETVVYVDGDIFINENYVNIIDILIKEPGISVRSRAAHIKSANNIDDVFSAKNFREENGGCDAFALNKKNLIDLMNHLPDFLIGSTKWDAYISEYLKAKTYVNDINSTIRHIDCSEKELIPSVELKYNEFLYMPHGFDKYIEESKQTQRIKIGPTVIQRNFTNKTISRPTTTICAGYRNRLDFLKRTLPTWLKQDVDEVLIVDWGSDEPLVESLKDIKDDRLVIVRVDDQTYYQRAAARNVKTYLSSGDYILSTDSDILFLGDWREMVEDFSNLRTFYTGNFSENHTIPKSQWYLRGTSFMYKFMFFEVMGYDEEAFGDNYGSEETDLFERAVRQGFKQEYFYPKHEGIIEHIPHSDELRYSQTKNGIKEGDDFEKLSLGGFDKLLERRKSNFKLEKPNMHERLVTIYRANGFTEKRLVPNQQKVWEDMAKPPERYF